MKKRISVFLMTAVMMICLAPEAFAKEDEDKDEVLPELTSIAVQSKTVYPGGTIVVSADAQDDDSGVKSITAFFSREAGNAKYSVKLLLNSDEDVVEEYSGILQIPKEAPSGRYMLHRVVVLDQEGNRASYSTGQTSWDEERGQFPLEWNAAFTVQKGEAPPEPVSCAVTVSGERNTLTFRASGAGLDKATLLFENSENFHKYVISVGSDDLGQDGTYRKEISISPYEPSGTFALKQVVIKNLTGESRTWSASIDDDDEDEDRSELLLPFSASFVANSSHLDTIPPELLSISVGNGVRDSEDEKTRYPIRAVVSDDLSGVEHITIKFKDPVSGKTISKVLRASDLIRDNQYSGEMPVKFDQTPGIYQLDGVTVCDRAGNRMTYCTQEDLTEKKRLLPVTVSVPVNR